MILDDQTGDERSERVIRVVLVDRHAMVREGLSHILTAEPGIAVVGAAGDGHEAILLTASRQPNVCILDADLPQVAQILQAVINQLAQHQPGTLSADEVSQEALSARELEVLGLLCQGRADKEIAQTLYLSVRTVNSHVSHVYAKLGVGTRTEAMHVAFQRGLVDVATTPPTPAHQ